MPNSASAKKDLRQNQTRRTHNRAVRSVMRRQVGAVRAAVKAGDIEKAEAEFRLAAKRLDKAGAKRIIHPNVADRTKSRLQHMIKAAKTASAAS